MRITKVLLICLCCLIAVPAVWGQAANSNRGILGYLDPQTGAFRPVAPAAEDALVEPPALTTFTGTISLTITVTLKTTGITNVVCSMNASVDDALTSGSPRIFEESDTVSATGSGSTRTCKLSIPYSWALSTASTDNMSTGYTVNGGGTSLTTPPFRSSSLSPLDTRKVPASGATTTLTASVTL